MQSTLTRTGLAAMLDLVEPFQELFSCIARNAKSRRAWEKIALSILMDAWRLSVIGATTPEDALQLLERVDMYVEKQIGGRGEEGGEQCRLRIPEDFSRRLLEEREWSWWRFYTGLEYVLSLAKVASISGEGAGEG